MNKIYNPEKSTLSTLLERPTATVDAIETIVDKIFNEVQTEGDKAILRYTQKFDKVLLSSMLVSTKEIKEAITLVTPELKAAIQLAKKNIEKFHQAQKTTKLTVAITDGVQCWQEKKPIQKIGIYIPGGTAPLFSTVLMLAIPAQIAGCEEIVLCSPPSREGKIHPATIFTAQLCGVTKIYKVGGIQAIGGMAFGTLTIPKVYKIFGPGNQYVTVAKQLVTKYNVAIDMPAGPSELLVVTDDSANPAFVASDLLSQAEHGIDSQVIMISTSKEMIIQVEEEIQQQLNDLPRKGIAEKAIENSKLIYVANHHIALDLINEYSPEHFIICTDNTDFYVNGIQNAGSVFIGSYSPESAGDYASGTNHTLPTNGYAKQYSGVNLDSFTKSITFQKITKKGIQKIGKTIEIMAEAEGLYAHKNAVTLRLKSINAEFVSESHN